MNEENPRWMNSQKDSRLLSFYLSALHDLGQALAVKPDRVERSRPLRESLYRILGTFAIGRGALLIHDEASHQLEPVASKGLRSRRGLEFKLTRAQARALAR